MATSRRRPAKAEMDPATIYAITVIVSGDNLPDISIVPLPPEWTLADCIEQHEKKFTNAPDTRAMCVSWQRFKRPPTKRYLISIDADSHAVHLTKWKGTLSECEQIVNRYSDKVTAFCVEARKLETTTPPRHG